MQIRVIKKKKGLGDKMESVFSSLGVSSLIKAVGIEDCGCEERKKMVNNAESWVKAKLQSITQTIQKQEPKGSSSNQNTTSVLVSRNTEQNLEQSVRSAESTVEEERM